MEVRWLRRSRLLIAAVFNSPETSREPILRLREPPRRTVPNHIIETIQRFFRSILRDARRDAGGAVAASAPFLKTELDFRGDTRYRIPFYAALPVIPVDSLSVNRTERSCRRYSSVIFDLSRRNPEKKTSRDLRRFACKF